MPHPPAEARLAVVVHGPPGAAPPAVPPPDTRKTDRDAWQSCAGGEGRPTWAAGRLAPGQPGRWSRSTQAVAAVVAVRPIRGRRNQRVTYEQTAEPVSKRVSAIAGAGLVPHSLDQGCAEALSNSAIVHKTNLNGIKSSEISVISIFGEPKSWDLQLICLRLWPKRLLLPLLMSDWPT
jgi:hypothetical protein